MSAILECMTATLYSASLQPAALQQTNPRSSTRQVSQQPRTEVPRHRIESVPAEFLRTDIIFLDPCLCQHFPHCRNHGGRARDVVDRSV